MAANSSLLKKVSPEDIFNLPLYENYLVIDTRPREDYDKSHIATAVSYPSLPPHEDTSRKEETLVEFARNYVSEYYKPENPNPLVIYGNGTQEELDHTQWLTDRLLSLKSQRSSLSLYSHQQSTERQEQALIEDYDPFEDFCQTVIDKVQQIWLLDGSYDSFLSEYSFLCGHIKFEDMFPIPHQITRNIFMSSRVVPILRETLSKMNISHMIISEHQDIDVSQLVDISVLNCSVRDSNEEYMLPCWEACCKFIDEAVLANGRVLIFLHGRSRSASVVLAYLIRSMRIDFQSAWQYLRNKCWHLIDRSLVYESQLHQWYQSTLAVTN